jgi:aspartate/methionine/tyrosine aminotransferase
MPETPPLSTRGNELVSSSPMPEYIAEHFVRSAAVEPDDDLGYIGLAISENKLVWDLLEPMFNRNRQVEQRSTGYDTMVGSERFRDSVAAFASEHVWGRTVKPDQVITLAGAGSVLETLFYVIANPGDGVLVPTPSYAGFWADLETRDELHIVPVHTSVEDSFAFTADHLQDAYDNASMPIAALLLTNPSNPTGRIHTDTEIGEAVDWARSVGIHVVVNEIYALSTHGETPFVPTGSIVDADRDDIHFVWAFSKDFALSGLRCGVLTSHNDDVRSAVSELAYWSIVSGDTQHLLDTMLRDNAWIDEYLTTMRSRLGDSYGATTKALEAAGIPYVPADAGLFVLCDLREFLAEPTWGAERLLWKKIIDEANVNLTPGSACHIDEPGFMRLCFAVEPAGVVVGAIERIRDALRG